VYGVLAHLLNLLSGSRHSNLTRDALCALSNPSVRGVDPSRRLPWLPLETRRAAGGCVAFEPSDTKLRYYPFAGLVSHAGAAHGPLAPLVVVELKRMIAAGDRWVFLYCGGDAPIDFILAYLPDDGSTATIRLWMVDTKHSQRGDGTLTKADVVEMQDKAYLVYMGMKRELEQNQCLNRSVTVQFDITRDFWLFSTLPSTTHDCIITRELFQHLPWARYLFAAAELARS